MIPSIMRSFQKRYCAFLYQIFLSSVLNPHTVRFSSLYLTARITFYALHFYLFISRSPLALSAPRPLHLLILIIIILLSRIASTAFRSLPIIVLQIVLLNFTHTNKRTLQYVLIIGIGLLLIQLIGETSQDCDRALRSVET